MRRAEASSSPPRAISAIRKASPGSDSASRIAAAISPSSQSLLTGLTDLQPLQAWYSYFVPPRPRPDTPGMLRPHSAHMTFPDSTKSPQLSSARAFLPLTPWTAKNRPSSTMRGMPSARVTPPQEYMPRYFSLWSIL